MLKVITLILSLFVVTTTANKTVHTFCHQVKSNGDNLRYCNLTTVWEPRISKSGLTTISVILSIISGVSTIYVLIKVAPTVSRTYTSISSFPSCLCCYPCYVVIPVLKLIWDGIDIMLDVYTFQKLETGKLIDPVIYRNTNVVNAILVFTIFGIGKLFFNMWVLLKCSKYFVISQKEDMANIKRATILTAFLLEDSIELLLEYFWIEKYFTYSPPFFLFGRDVFIAMIVVCTIIIDLKDLKDESSSKYQKGLYAVMVIIGITELLRVSSAAHQLSVLSLNDDCFTVDDGRLVQTPFNSKCLKHVEYAVVIALILSILSCFYIFLIPTKILVKKDDTISPTTIEEEERTNVSVKEKLTGWYKSITT